MGTDVIPPAILGLQGAALVVGPAGSGKTTTLVDRYVSLVRSGETGVLMLVGSRRAARALSDRIVRELATSTDQVRVATWHSFAQSVVTENFAALGYQKEPGLLAGPDHFALVRELLDAPEERLHWGEHRRHLALKGFVHELREFILRAQDALLSPEELEDMARARGRTDLVEASRFFRRYLDNIDLQCLVDYANVIARAVNAVQDPSLAAVGRAVKLGTRHLLVDDYHDVTPAQQTLLRELFVDGGSVMVAGDPSLRVWGFRGASESSLDEFRKHFAPVTETVLIECRRGAPRAEAWRFDHLTEEAESIARACKRAQARDGVSLGDIAIIVRRYGATARAIRRALDNHGLAYVVVGENRPLSAETALRPMLDLARVAFNTADRDELLPGLLASPAVGLDTYEVRALRRDARVRDIPLSVLIAAPPEDLAEHIRLACVELHARLGELLERDATQKRPDHVFWYLWETLPYFREMVARGDDAELDAVAAFARAIERYSDRRPGHRFSQYVETLEGVEFGPEPWRMPDERRPDAVRLMTAHHAVGTEFEITFVAGAVEGDFPDTRDKRAMLDLRDLIDPADPVTRQRARLEEEKRLFGIATSRARSRLIITAARESSQREGLAPTPFLHLLGLEWSAPPPGDEPITRDDAEAHYRRIARDRARPETERREAISHLARIAGLDPSRWWFQRDWTDTDTPLIGEEFRTSYSRLSPFEDCGLKYLYQVELGLDPDQTHNMLVGSWVHDIVDRCAQGDVPATDEALLAELRAVWKPEAFPNNAIEDRARRECEAMLKRWLAADGKVKPLATEVEFAFDIEGARLRGFIDRVARIGGRSVRLTDYKTGKGWRSQLEVEEDLQLATYFLAMKRDPNLVKLGEPMYMELGFIARERGDTGYYKPHFDPRKKANYEAETEQRLVELVRGIRAEEFAPRPDADCKWCKFKTLCPVWAEGDEVTL